MSKYGRWVILVVILLSAATAVVCMTCLTPPSSRTQMAVEPSKGTPVQPGDSPSTSQRVVSASVPGTETSSDSKLVSTTALTDKEQSRSGSTNRPAGDRRRWQGLQDRMDKLKETDPEQYKAIMAKRDAAKQKVQNAFAERAAYLLSVDTSGMTDDELASYEKMTQLLDHMWGLSQKMQGGDLKPEERQALRDLVRQDTQALDPLLLAQRDREWLNVGQQAGYSSEDARKLADYFNKVLDLTNLRNAFPGGGPGGGGPGGVPSTPEQRQVSSSAAQTALADKAAYFAGLDVSSMTPAEQQNRDKIIQALAAVQKAAQGVGPDVSQQDRRAAGAALRDAVTTLDPLLSAQRDAEWYKAGLQLGYAPADAQAFVTYMNRITDLTSTRTIFRNMRSGIPNARIAPSANAQE